MYSSPLYASPSHSTPSGVRGRWKNKERTRLLPSSDRQRGCATGSLDRAIGAARHMRHTSGHMARSLATGVQYQELLTRTCSYQTADSSHRQHGLSHLRGSSSPRAEGAECWTRMQTHVGGGTQREDGKGAGSKLREPQKHNALTLTCDRTEVTRLVVSEMETQDASVRVTRGSSGALLII
ncbi:hypothetical protein EYF80_053101 [Liparis tanakae]|uniref:Uncharacterized protein n=1 Tax=Liparis tanakae TaxID=230148 RepID=A0A4Z2F645_9TELE|nr:hypothetical protein EYF80_053101 [Liparis tanakae]